jgi:malate dehydrogenase (oxaloacetate-decarboxylating)(NADP+)
MTLPVIKKNLALLQDPALTKSTAFTREEREELGLRGLLPYMVSSQQVQIERVMGNLRRKEFDIERYIFLSALQDRNERLFYQTVIQHFEEIMPLIYTPTVGQACKEFSHIFRHAKGLFITPEDRGEIEVLFDNWPVRDVRVIVVTDGERILGLGDLGANGMGIPIGKLALYCACAGIHPHQCLPVMLDVGTNNKEILDDPLYIGYPHIRLKGEEYVSLVHEFVLAVQNKFPDALIQFEDFLTPNAYAFLQAYKERFLCFNDDIQGTASVVLAGLYASGRITGRDYKDMKIMFLGAGSAGTGIADLLVRAFEAEGLTKKEAYERLWFVDGTGLVVSSRTDLAEHKIPYAHNFQFMNFLEAIDTIKPHALIGATAAANSFPKEAIEKMSALNERPVIFALSNPTAKAECTAQQAYEWSKGKAVFASGSPFAPVDLNGQHFKSGQGNNAYIFPGVGLGAVVSKAKILKDLIFMTAAKTLAQIVSPEDIASGSLYPPLTDIREISLEIAVAVAEKIYDEGLARTERPDDIRKAVSDFMYDPRY